MRKTLKRTGIALLCVAVVIIIIAAAVFSNEIRSLVSIRRLDNYGMFQMTYYGDYGFDEFLKTGASGDGDIEEFIVRRLLKGLPVDLGITSGGCTVFVTRDENGDIIYGRNFDFSYSPSMQIVTKPKNGYASISTVNLAFVGYSESKLPSGLNFKSFLTLAAPFLPFDGMNEKGLAIASLAVPGTDPPPYDEGKITLNTTTAMRLVLDKAATVDEAVELLKQYNIYFSGGIDCHFLAADAGGRSAIIEYYDGDMRVTPAGAPYQIASNFIAYNGLNIGEGYSEFERYDAVRNAIENNGGRLGEEQAAALLAEVGVRSEGEDKLQWSVVYNLTALDGTIFAHRKSYAPVRFQLN